MPSYTALSAREKQALNLKAQGKTNDETAAAMHISVGRVEALLTAARSKLRAKTTKEAIEHARDANML